MPNTREHTNGFLSVLSHESRASLLARSIEVAIPAEMEFYEAGKAPVYAWFLTSGLASTVSVTAGGCTAEVGSGGKEGVVGCFHLLGPAHMPTRCFMQLSGAGFRILFSELQQAFWSSAEIRGRLLELMQEQVAILQLGAVCHLQHDAGPRLASSLLVVQDKTQQHALHLTQEVLAKALGTTRSTVSLLAADLQRRGLITYSRGQVKILDRERLEAAACGCYPINRNLQRSLYRDSVPASEFVNRLSA